VKDQRFSMGCRPALLVGATLAGVLGTTVTVRAQALKDIQTPDTPLVLKAQAASTSEGRSPSRRRKAGKCRFVGFTGHFDPEAHAAMLKAYDKWDTVMMPVHAADHAYLSFEQIALPVAAERGVATQAIKIFGKANLLRSLSSSDCLRYALSQPSVQVAICGCGTVGQMEDNIRAVGNFKKMTPEECVAVRKRAISGQGVYTGTTLEYWKKKA